MYREKLKASRLIISASELTNASCQSFSQHDPLLMLILPFVYEIVSCTNGMKNIACGSHKFVLSAVPSGFPQDVSGIANSPSSITLAWSPPIPEEQGGVIVNYVVRITNTDSVETSEHTSTSTSISITGLQPFTTFVCVVAAATSLGVGPFSHLYFVQTPESGM